MFDYAGCIHFHSAYSYDARIALPQILEDALKAEIDFAIVTDHFRLDARQEGWEGYYPRTDARGLPQGPTRGQHVLCLVGEEISPRYNHYVALGLKEPVVVWKNHAEAQQVIDAVKAQGGFGFIAHPDHVGAPLLASRAFPWVDWKVRGYAGLGLWDLMSDWGSGMTSPWGVLRSFLWPVQVLNGPSRKTIERWDALTQEGHCVVIGETDNHGNVRSFFGIRRQLFPFETAFKTIRTHVLLSQPLTGQSALDQTQILEALRLGRSYVSLDFWQQPAGFNFEVYDDQQRATMGENFVRKGPALIDIKVSVPGPIRLLRNGRVIAEERRRAYVQRDLELPGVYRVEVDQKAGGRTRPWIFSNPIWVS